MPEPAQLAPLNVEDQWVYSHLLWGQSSSPYLWRKLILDAWTWHLVLDPTFITLGGGRNVDRPVNKGLH